MITTLNANTAYEAEVYEDEDRTILDRGALESGRSALQSALRAAEPFPHVVIDDFLEPSVACAAYERFPKPDCGPWTHYKHINERKVGRSELSQFPDVHRRIVEELSSSFFTTFLSNLTEIPGLFADPELEGGGLHQTEEGGFLAVHTDFSSHTHNRTWARRVNVLIFFNPDWRQEYGGTLEFWDADAERCVTRIVPAFNRCVIFPTGATTYHGHPGPIVRGLGATRKSLALYYFDDTADSRRAKPTVYRPAPGASLSARTMVRLDNGLLAGYAALKRRFGFSDRVVSRLLQRLFR